MNRKTSIRSRKLVPLLAAFLSLAPVTARAQDSTLNRPLTLGDAARLGARQSALSLGARERAAQASARVGERRADLFPVFDVTAAERGNTLNTATFGFSFPGLDPRGSILGPVQVTDLRAHLSENLVDFGAIGRVRSARAAAAASQADAANSAEQGATNAASAYLRLQRAEANEQAGVADSALADELLRIAREQLNAGVGIALDVTRAQAQLARIRAQLIVARNERDRAQLELLRSLGLTLDVTLRLSDSLSNVGANDTVPTEAEAVQRALTRRPDLRAAEEQLRAANEGISAIRAERLPSLGVFGDQGQIAVMPHGAFLPTYTWGVQVSLPIFDGFRREARVEEQRAVAREVTVRERDLRQQVAIEVRGALLDLSSARQQVDAARGRLLLAEQELSQARERFRAGVAGDADVITASLGLNQSRTQLVDALTSYQVARVSLARAQGSITELP